MFTPFFEENEVTENWRSFARELERPFEANLVTEGLDWFREDVHTILEREKVTEPSLPLVRALENTSKTKRSRSFPTLHEYVVICFEKIVATEISSYSS